MDRRDAKFLARFDSLTIEQARGETYRRETFAVYGHGTYGRDSVLEGQPLRAFVAGGFSSADEAKVLYPEAEVIEGTTHVPHRMLTRHIREHNEADDYRNEE